MLPKNLKSIYQKYLPIYKSRLKLSKDSNLKNFIFKEAEKGKENYKKLSSPKIYSIDNYIYIWVRRAVDIDLASKSIKKISLEKPPISFKSTARYISLFPEESSDKFSKKLFSVPLEKRRKTWDSFNLPFKKIEKAFIEMSSERVEFAHKKGFSSYIDMYLEMNNTPSLVYKHLIEGQDKVIKYCNEQLAIFKNLSENFYSEFNRPCFICNLPSFPLKTNGETIGYFIKKYPILNRIKDKIKITLGDRSEIIYKKENDIFQIIINKNLNSRHKIMDLIHELSHLTYNIKNLENRNKTSSGESYLREKEALKIELSMLKSLSDKVFKASLGEALLIYHRILFEIELYKKPRQNLSKLYAEIFNKCFKKAKQENNPLFILDEYVTLRPFSSLPHALAYSEVLNTFIK